MDLEIDRNVLYIDGSRSTVSFWSKESHLRRKVAIDGFKGEYIVSGMSVR
jgi:hypothetical protein